MSQPHQQTLVCGACPVPSSLLLHDGQQCHQEDGEQKEAEVCGGWVQPGPLLCDGPGHCHGLSLPESRVHVQEFLGGGAQVRHTLQHSDYWRMHWSIKKQFLSFPFNYVWLDINSGSWKHDTVGITKYTTCVRSAAMTSRSSIQGWQSTPLMTTLHQNLPCLGHSVKMWPNGWKKTPETWQQCTAKQAKGGLDWWSVHFSSSLEGSPQPGMSLTTTLPRGPSTARVWPCPPSGATWLPLPPSLN